METTESLKRQVATAEDLHALVRTMKALAAVNIRQLEHAVESLHDYRRTIELGLRVVLRKHGGLAATPRFVPHQTLGVIVFGSDQGMCGALNDHIVHSALDYLGEQESHVESLVTLSVGARVAARLEDAGVHLDAALSVAGSTSGITSLVQEILLRVDSWHVDQDVNRVVVFHCEQTSRANYRPQRMDLLPIDRRWLHEIEREQWPTNMLPQFTMDAERLFSALVRQYLFVSLFRACAESMASENASRLAAMRGAERNIGERIVELTSRFHQTRQMAITEELLDIAAGFEALNDASN